MPAIARLTTGGDGLAVSSADSLASSSSGESSRLGGGCEGFVATRATGCRTLRLIGAGLSSTSSFSSSSSSRFLRGSLTCLGIICDAAGCGTGRMTAAGLGTGFVGGGAACGFAPLGRKLNSLMLPMSSSSDESESKGSHGISIHLHISSRQPYAV